MVVDVTAPITINVLAAPFAVIDALRQLDAATGIWYSLYPEGQQGYGTPNNKIWFNLRIRNGGDATGNIYVKVTRIDTGEVIYNQSFSLSPNTYYDISTNGPNCTMPNAPLTLNFEIGH